MVPDEDEINSELEKFKARAENSGFRLSIVFGNNEPLPSLDDIPRIEITEEKLKPKVKVKIINDNKNALF